MFVFGELVVYFVVFGEYVGLMMDGYVFGLCVVFEYVDGFVCWMYEVEKYVDCC